MFLLLSHFIHHSHKGKGKVQRSKREKGKLGAPAPHKRQRKRGSLFRDRIPLGNQTARTHAQHDTKRFLGWTYPPTSDVRSFAWAFDEGLQRNIRNEASKNFVVHFVKAFTEYLKRACPLCMLGSISVQVSDACFARNMDNKCWFDTRVHITLIPTAFNA